MFPLNLKNKNPLDYNTIIFHDGRTINDYCREIQYNNLTWKQISDNLKNHIREILLPNQSYKCAYCGGPIGDTSLINIEHIAPKKLYPEFIVERNNLVLSCDYCNNKKREWDTIETMNAMYENCEFKIVHPYFDDPVDHYRQLLDRFCGCLLIQYITDKGKETIEKLNLNREQRILERYKVVEDVVNPFIEQILTYK